MNKNSFLKKFVLVTGAGSGIGHAIAQKFLEEGAHVGVHYSSNKKGAEQLVKSAEGRCHLIQADFSQSREVKRCWDEFLKWSGGKIDVLVNNAATPGPGKVLDEVTEAEWDEVFQINLKAPMLLGREALKIMRKQRSGRIINISSIGVKYAGGGNTVPYSISKAALEALTRSQAKQAAEDGVLVNAIQVGVTNTEFHQKIGRNDLKSRAAMIPLKRVASAPEIANSVLFLASDSSSFVTGAVIPVSGGE